MHAKLGCELPEHVEVGVLGPDREMCTQGVAAMITSIAPGRVVLGPAHPHVNASTVG